MATAQQQQALQPTAEEEAMTKVFAQDRPTIDAAVKSFISLICAKSLTSTPSDDASSSNNGGSTDASNAEPVQIMGIVPMKPLTAHTGAPSTQQQVLEVGRVILKAVNSHKFPIHLTVAKDLMGKPGISEEKKNSLFETHIAAQLWNGLVDSTQKPSRFLGRKALRYAWQDMNVQLSAGAKSDDGEPTEIQQKQQEWLSEFSRLLFVDAGSVLDGDDDAALIWAADGGQEELAKRRQRRKDRASSNGQIVSVSDLAA